jgi:hypothetical protein
MKSAGSTASWLRKRVLDFESWKIEVIYGGTRSRRRGYSRDPRCPNWEPGKVLTLEGVKARVYLRNLFVTKLDQGLKQFW